MPVFRCDQVLRGRRGEALPVGVLIAPADLTIDPAVAERLFERLIVGEAGRLDRAFLGQDEPDSSRVRVVLAQPGPPGGGIVHKQLRQFTRHPLSVATR